MAEKSYIGFKAAPGIDWGKLTSEFSQGLMDIGARRGQQDAYFDQLQRENMQAVRETENFQTQDLNTLLSGAISQNVDNSYEMNRLVKSGKINHNAYRNFMNNASDDWKSFATTAKTLDETIMKGLERQQPGENGLPAGSKYEEDLIERRSELLNLKNRTMYQDPKTGKYFLADLDETGNISDYNNLHNVKSLNNPMNVNDNFFDFNTLVTDRAKNLKEYTVGEMEDVDGKQIYVTEKGQVMNPELPGSISRVQAYIKKTPRLVYNTLSQSDNRYESYFDPKDQEGGDYQRKMNSFIEIENGARRIKGEKPLTGEELNSFVAEYDRFLMPNITDGQGVFQPSPSQDQLMALDQVVESTFMSNLGYSKMEEKPSKKSKKTDGKSKPGSEMSQADANVLYKQLRNAWDKIDTDPVQAAAIFTNQAVDGSEFTIKEDGYLYKLAVENIWNEKEGRSVRTEREIGPIKNMQDISTSFFGATGGKGAGKANTLYQNAEKSSGKGPAVIAMMGEQTEEMPADQMASNQGGNFFTNLVRSGRNFLSGGNNQNIS